MAKGSYTRRQTQGGRFRRQDFGDLGLRSFAEQQKQVIDSIKIQRARAKEINSEFAQSMGDVAANEQRNRTILQDLENEAYETRRKAMDVRAEREIEALEGKAKEYGKQKERWLQFSTTEAEKWGKLASGALATIDKIKADIAWPEIEKQLEMIAAGNNEASKAIEKNASKDADKNWKTNPNISRTLLDWITGSGTNLSHKFRAWYEANSHITPIVGQELAEQAGKNYNDDPSYWNKLALKNLAAKAGVKEGTAGYQKALQKLYAISGQQTHLIRNQRDTAATADQIKKHTDLINSLDKTASDYEENLQLHLGNLIGVAATGTWKDKDKFVRGLGNRGLAGTIVVEALLETKHYSTYKEVLQLFQDYTTDNGQSYYERHFVNHGDDWEKGWNRYNTKQKNQLKRAEEGRAIEFNTKLENLKALTPEDFIKDKEGKSKATELGWTLDGFNIDDPRSPYYSDSRALLFQMLKSANLKPADMDQLSRNVLRWDSSNTLSIYTHAQLESAAIAGNWAMFNHIYAGIKNESDKDEVAISNLYSDFPAIQSLGTRFRDSGKQIITDLEKGYSKLGFSLTNKNASAAMIRITEVKLKETFIHNTDRSLNTEERFKQALDLVEEQAKAGKGVFRNTPGSENLATQWHAVTADKKNIHDGVEYTLLPLTSKDGEESILSLTSPYLKGDERELTYKTPEGEEVKDKKNAFKKFIEKYRGQLLHVDTIEEATISVLQGSPIAQNDVVTFLAQRFDTTESAVWKELGVQASPSLVDQVHMIKPSEDSKAYTEWVKSLHLLENKIAFNNLWHGKELTGVFPTTPWTKDLINYSSESFTTADIPFESSELTNELANLLEIDRNDKFLGMDVLQSSTRTPDGLTRTNPINVTNARAERKVRRARINDLKRQIAAASHFELNIPENFILNKEQFGGYFNAYTGETLWPIGGELNRTWNQEKAAQIKRNLEEEGK